MVNVTAFGLSDVGRVREDNEDTIVVDGDHGFYLVADGMGGHLGGKTASLLAANTVHNLTKEMMLQGRLDAEAGQVRSQGALAFAVAQAVREASGAVYHMAQRHLHLRRMGTTLTCVCIENDYAVVAHVGDSRCYVWRDQTLSQLTSDHSYVNEQIQAGLLARDDARVHQYRNIITRSVGIEPNILVDVHGVDLEPGDCLVLCSDGLSNMVDDAMISDVLVSENNPEEVCEQLLEMALRLGGTDNVSVICIMTDR